MGAGEGDCDVVCNQQARASNDIPQNLFLTVDASGEPKTCGFEFDRVCRAPDLRTRTRYRHRHRVYQTGSAFCSFHVIGRPSEPVRQDATESITDEGRRAGLAAIDSEEKPLTF
jgi:hypothetical protein